MVPQRQFNRAWLLAFAALFCACVENARSAPPAAASDNRIELLRVPDGGLQPQVVMDPAGVLHLVYFHGDPGKGDLFYVRSTDAGASFSKPLRVNDHAKSAIAIGNIRGAHLAIGKSAHGAGYRAHVAWNGAAPIEVAGGKHVPMWYTRLADDGRTFEAQRNLIGKAFGLDGGGSVCADDAGNVYVAWHASEPGTRGEQQRRVWLVKSRDEGRSFDSERAISPSDAGACGCCGMRAQVDRGGRLHVLFRTASTLAQRDAMLLVGRGGDDFRADNIGKWTAQTCPMSSFALTPAGDKLLAAWETERRIYWSAIDKDGRLAEPVAASEDGKGSRLPVVAANDRGEVLVAWTVGVGWQRGGSLAWTLYDAARKPIASGEARGVPTWSLIAACARRDGRFVIIY